MDIFVKVITHCVRNLTDSNQLDCFIVLIAWTYVGRLKMNKYLIELAFHCFVLQISNEINIFKRVFQIGWVRLAKGSVEWFDN